MRMFGIVLRGLRGRKRDSLTLGTVLLLSFLFLVASSIVLSSVAFTAQQQRQALYGNWQAMYHDVRREDLAAYEGLEGVSVMHLLGETNDGRTIASINEDVVAAGNLQLVEGRLPETEDEIVIVQGRMGDDLAVGDTYSLRLDYDYMAGSTGTDYLALRVELIKEALAEPLTVHWYGMVNGKETDLGEYVIPAWDEVLEIFEQYLEENFDPETGNLPIGIPDSGRYAELNYGFSTLEELKLMLEDEYHFYTLFTLWVDMWFAEVYAGNYDAFAIDGNGVLENALHGAAGFNIRIDGSHVEYKLIGGAYTAEQRSRKIQGSASTSNMSLYREYTVVGVIAPYADHWDVRGYAMPDAFVSEIGVGAYDEAIAYAEQFFYDGAASYQHRAILLYHDPALDARTATGKLLEIFNAQQTPYYRVEDILTEHGVDPNYQYIIGLDAETGEEVKTILELRRDGYYMDNYFIGDDLEDLAGYEAAMERYLPLPAKHFTVDGLYDDNTDAFRINSFAYPAAGGTEESLQTLLSGVLVGVVACATFQIFWVQLRRRKTRLATMLAIGATDGQIFRMLLLEVALLLIVAGVIGAALGFGLAQLLLDTAVKATWHPDWQHLLTGIVCAAAAVFAGALIPMLLALRTPLTGREQATKSVLKLKPPKGEVKPQRYWRIVLRSMRVNRGKTSLQCVFAWLLATICLLTVFLCHNAFDSYRREVEAVARPDYELELPYAMSRGFLQEVAGSMDYDGAYDAAIEGGGVTLDVSNWSAESPILRTLVSMGECDGETLPVRVIGAGEQSALLARIMDMVPAGSVTETQILDGEACVLLVPRYVADGDAVARKKLDSEVADNLDADQRPGALLELSFDPTMQAMTEADTAVRVGDTITLRGYSTKTSGDGIKNAEREVSVRVAAVVSVLDEALWPFTGETPAYWVLSGDRLIYQIYPYSGIRMTAEQVPYHKLMTEVYSPDCYGHTVFYLTNPEGSDGIAQDTAAANFAEAYGMDFSNLRLLNERVWSDAVKSSMMLLLLGVEMALVVLTILLATAASAVEQDRKRYGTLQAIGVGGRQLAWGQILQALGVGILACVAANLTVALVICLSAAITAIGQAAYWPMLLRNIVQSINGYPWAVHGILCAAYLIVYVFAESRPIFRVSRADPIDNIRS